MFDKQKLAEEKCANWDSIVASDDYQSKTQHERELMFIEYWNDNYVV